MATNTNAPTMLLFYTLLLAFWLLPKAYDHLRLAPSISLSLHLLTTTCVFIMATYLATDATTNILSLLYTLLAFLLRRFWSLHLPKLSLPVSAENKWVKELVAVVLGTSATIYIFQAKVGDWQQAKRNLIDRRNKVPTVATAEQGGVVEEPQTGSGVAWAGYVFVYVNTLFESKDWFVEVAGGDVEGERSLRWTLMSAGVPMAVAGAVGVGRWMWIAKTRKAQEEKQRLSEKVSEKQQVWT